jgi:1,2-phenylacetyl-CoA epoxidase catalytic subunit
MTNPESGRSAESRKWFTHFSLRSMTALHVSPNEAVQLTNREIGAITASIQQFQLGESSRGQRLMERGQKYGRTVNDPMFAGALEMLVKEEQQHSQYLAAFMESQGIPRLRKHWVDSIFRKLLVMAGLELSLTVLATAEMIAVPYYRALRAATGSPILKLICTRILEDEASHLRFQASMLGRIGNGRTAVLQRTFDAAHRFFFLGTLLVVWREHRGVFELAGYNFWKFQEEAISEYSKWRHARQAGTSPADPRAAVAPGRLGHGEPQAILKAANLRK